MEQETLFSQAALDALHTTKTDVLNRTVGNWMWFLLAAVTIVLGALVFWGFFGVLSADVAGVGLTMRSGGVSAVTAGGSGIIENLSIAPGMSVSRHRVLGQIYNPEQFFRLSKLEAEYEQLKQYLEQVQQGTEIVSKQAVAVEQIKEKELKELLAKLDENRKRHDELSKLYKNVSSLGAVSKVDYFHQLEEAIRVDTSIASLLQQYADSSLQQAAINWQNIYTRLEGIKQRQIKEQELALAVKLSRETFRLRSDVDGTIVEVLKDSGDAVRAGEHVALVSTSKFADIKVVGFVPMEEGKKIKPGMSAFFAPSAYNPREFGYIRGVVLETSPFAVSMESIAAELKNADMVKSIGGKKVQMRVAVELFRDRNAPSRLKWTSRHGAPAPLDAGFFGALLVNTEQRPPISYIVPYVREKLLGIGKIRTDEKDKGSGS
jgi:HlyD family secretion protein